MDNEIQNLTVDINYDSDSDSDKENTKGKKSCARRSFQKVTKESQETRR